MNKCCDEDINDKLLLPCKTVFVAAVILIDSDNKILISKRPQNKEMPGLWEFPGGKIKLEQNETAELAAIRELKEELGIDSCAACLQPYCFASHRYDSFHLLMPVFKLRNWKNTPTPKEGQELKWIRPIEIAKYKMPEANASLIELVRMI